MLGLDFESNGAPTVKKENEVNVKDSFRIHGCSRTAKLTGSEIFGNLSLTIKELQIENPARFFARAIKAGGFDEYSEKQITAIAELSNVLANAWTYNPITTDIGGSDMRPYMNAVQVLNNLIWIVYEQMVVLRNNGLN